VILPLRVTPEAQGQIVAIDDWWRSNRLGAADIFLDELTSCFNLIAAAPDIGRLYRQSPLPGTRRILLRRSCYHVYYVHQPAEVRVVAIWHARRGVGPPLRQP
jgi:plasmid stabilization system protein ParE